MQLSSRNIPVTFASCNCTFDMQCPLLVLAASRACRHRLTAVHQMLSVQVAPVYCCKQTLSSAALSSLRCTQVMIYEILDAWGREGLITHVKKMQTEYKERAAIVQEAAGVPLAPTQRCASKHRHQSSQCVYFCCVRQWQLQGLVQRECLGLCFCSALCIFSE